MSETDRERVEIEDVARDGDGVGRLSGGKVVFVPGALPGEIVDIGIDERQSEYARGTIEKVVERAEARIAPDCPQADRCGGCKFWHVRYERELALKEDALATELDRRTPYEFGDVEIAPSPTSSRYRSTVSMHWRPSAETLGFYEANSRELVEVRTCPVAREPVELAFAPVCDALTGVGPADVRIETADSASCVATITPDASQSRPPESVRRVAEQIEEIDVLRGIRFVGEDRPWVAGDASVDASEVLARPPVESMRVPAGLFRQANPEVNRALVDRVEAAVDELGGGDVLDLFCGAGNFTFALETCDSVLGLEGVEAAVEVADGAATLAGRGDVDVRRADLSDGYRSHLDVVGEGPFDVALLDPPRAGAAAVCRELAEADLSGIVYVSCNPRALGRDLGILAEGGWELEWLTGLDMFPRTSDVEVLAVLGR